MSSTIQGPIHNSRSGKSVVIETPTGREIINKRTGRETFQHDNRDIFTPTPVFQGDVHDSRSGKSVVIDESSGREIINKETGNVTFQHYPRQKGFFAWLFGL